MKPVYLTNRTKLRSAKRGITTGQIQVAYNYGLPVKTGNHLFGKARKSVRYFFLRKKDVPPWVDPKIMGRLQFLLIEAVPGVPAIITAAYKNTSALQKFKQLKHIAV